MKPLRLGLILSRNILRFHLSQAQSIHSARLTSPSAPIHLLNNQTAAINQISKRFKETRWGYKDPRDRESVTSRTLEVCRQFEKIDGDKLTIDSNFQKDMGLDSLDHVELIMAIEDEFGEEIPEDQSDKLISPQAIIDYIVDTFEADENR